MDQNNYLRSLSPAEILLWECLDKIDDIQERWTRIVPGATLEQIKHQEDHLYEMRCRFCLQRGPQKPESHELNCLVTKIKKYFSNHR